MKNLAYKLNKYNNTRKPQLSFKLFSGHLIWPSSVEMQYRWTHSLYGNVDPVGCIVYCSTVLYNDIVKD